LSFEKISRSRERKCNRSGGRTTDMKAKNKRMEEKKSKEKKGVKSKLR